MKCVFPILVSALLVPACSDEGKSGDDDTDTGADTDTDSDSDTDSDTDTDTDSDTDSDTDAENCEVVYNTVLSLCGPPRPDLLECCNTVWDQMMDVEQMFSCMLEAETCEDVIACDSEASYCEPSYCETGDVCCDEFSGEWGEIVDAFECSTFNWYEGGDGCWNVQVCYLGECVAAADVVDGLCP